MKMVIFLSSITVKYIWVKRLFDWEDNVELDYFVLGNWLECCHLLIAALLTSHVSDRLLVHTLSEKIIETRGEINVFFFIKDYKGTLNK